MVLSPQSDVGAGVPPLLPVRNLIKGSDMSNATLPVVASNQSIIIPNAVDSGLGVNFDEDLARAHPFTGNGLHLQMQEAACDYRHGNRFEGGAPAANPE